MEKNRSTREEVNSRLVSDRFFKKGYPILKIRQSILTILSWTGVFLPFLWLAIPFLLPDTAGIIHFKTYLEELITLDFLGIFLIIAFLIIAVLFIIFTLWNNHRFNHLLKKEVLHDEEQLEKKKTNLETFYIERFGPKAYRESVRFYSVKEEQNIDIETIQKLYQDGGES